MQKKTLLFSLILGLTALNFQATPANKSFYGKLEEGDDRLWEWTKPTNAKKAEVVGMRDSIGFTGKTILLKLDSNGTQEFVYIQLPSSKESAPDVRIGATTFIGKNAVVGSDQTFELRFGYSDILATVSFNGLELVVDSLQINGELDGSKFGVKEMVRKLYYITRALLSSLLGDKELSPEDLTEQRRRAFLSLCVNIAKAFTNANVEVLFTQTVDTRSVKVKVMDRVVEEIKDALLEIAPSLDFEYKNKVISEQFAAV